MIISCSITTVGVENDSHMCVRNTNVSRVLAWSVSLDITDSITLLRNIKKAVFMLKGQERRRTNLYNLSDYS
jgi:hypothetical protein